MTSYNTIYPPNSKPQTIINFASDDLGNPRNWPIWKKWLIFGAIILLDLSVSFGASGYSPAETSFEKSMHVSSEVATLGLSMYVAGLAFRPMALAPLSEYFGRNIIYIISYFICLLFLIGSILVSNLGGFLVLRLLSGLFSSVTIDFIQPLNLCLQAIANFGGTIADLYPSHLTGYAMSIFLWAATCGSPLGFFLFSCIAQYRGYRDVLWAVFGVSAGFWVIMTTALLYCGETRHSVLLLRRARQERQRMGRGEDEVHVPEEMERRGVKKLFQVALTRPFKFLGTEAIIIAGALYNGYLYGLSLLFNTAFSVVFGPTGKGFDTLQVGLTFLGIVFGITERYFRGKFRDGSGENVPEARVQMGKVAAIAFPISLFWFSWTILRVHPVVPILASALWGWSFYTLILMTYTYTEDSYGQFSASALAGLGLIRNLAGAGFPLFAEQLFKNEGDRWAGSILAFLALVLVPIPFVLERFGVRLRKRSPWASEHMEESEKNGKNDGARAERDG